MRLTVCALFLVMSGCLCAPNPKAPVDIMALLYNTGNKLGPRQTQLETIGNVAALKGSVVNLVGGASITLDSQNPLQQQLTSASTANDVANAFYTARGSEVHANLIDKAGILWPGDFHSWAMVTTYWNFEQAFKYYTRIYDGESTDELAGADVLYWAAFKNVDLPAERQDVFDNALYYPPVKAFVVVPFKDFVDGIPASMNLGIVGHEFAHRVFVIKAYGDQPLPVHLGVWQGEPLNIMKSVDEGLADFHGYGVTCITSGGPGCSTQYLLPTFGEEVAEPRDFSRSMETCMSSGLRTALQGPSDAFIASGFQYKLGTIIAAALYQAANKGGKLEIMQKALIRSYDHESNVTPGFRQEITANLNASEKFTLEKVAGIILSHITDPDLKRLTCNELWGRLDLANSTERPIPFCPNTSLRDSTCPPVP